jgi:Family of unknown function (DUF6459)
MPSRAFAVVRILRTGRRNMPSARTPDPAPAGSSRRSATSPPPAGKAGPLAVPPAGPPPAVPPAGPSLAGLPPGSSPTGPPSASTTARAPAAVSAFGGLRLVEVPGDWPPYDCEVHGTACPAAREVSVPSPCAHRERGAPEGAEPPGPSLAFSAGHPADGAADPVVAWSRQFAQVIVEILAGARSPRQLAPLTTERVRDRISLLTQTLTPGQRPRIRRIVTSRPAARVVEMTIVLSFGPRSRALALRLEQVPGRRPAPGLPGRPARWLCTEIEVG